MINTVEMVFKRNLFWNRVYQNKMTHQTGWYQKVPDTSLDLIKKAGISKNAKIIDIGGGDSLLVDHLLALGFKNISVLDVSKEAIDRTKKRLGDSASKINWIVSDVLDFKPTEEYDLWHDRACLHFLTNNDELSQYYRVVGLALGLNGNLIIGAFSRSGPTSCSGLPIKQYTCQDLFKGISEEFEHLESLETVHTTPANNKQNYVFCRFIKLTI